MKFRLITAFILAMSFIILACRKQDGVYKEFIRGGEITYAHKADSAKAYSGNERIQLMWLRGPDPNVTRATVYWNNRADSTTVTIPDTQPLDTVKVMLEDMEEGTYTFEVITFDRNGNRSVAVDFLGAVYGDLYQLSIKGRELLSIFYDKKLYLVWKGGGDDIIGQQIYFKTENGEDDMLLALSKKDTLSLPSYLLGSTIRYRSLFLPDSLAIDTFYSEFGETKFGIHQKSGD